MKKLIAFLLAVALLLALGGCAYSLQSPAATLTTTTMDALAESRQREEEESRRQEEQRRMDAVKPKNTYNLNFTDQYGYYSNYTLEIGSWIKASDTDMLNAAWSAVGGTGSFPSMSDLYQKMSGHFSFAVAFKQQASAVAFGRITRSTNGTFTTGDWSFNAFRYDGRDIDYYKFKNELGGFGFFYEGDNGYLISSPEGKFNIHKSGSSMPFAIVMSQVFTPNHQNGNPNIDKFTMHYGSNRVVFDRTW